jgi:hypothetical protein
VRFDQWLADKQSTGESTVRDVSGARVSRTTRGTFVDPFATGAGKVRKQRSLILADASNSDYLICRPFNSDYWNARRDLRTSLDAVPTAAQIAAEMGIDEADLTAYLALEVLVAKSPALRADTFDGQTIDMEVESWDGVTLTTETQALSYAYHSATLRTATDEDDNDELQTVIPRYIPEDSIIYAIATSGVQMTVGEQSVKLIDLNLDARAWMKTV